MSALKSASKVSDVALQAGDASAPPHIDDLLAIIDGEEDGLALCERLLAESNQVG